MKDHDTMTPHFKFILAAFMAAFMAIFCMPHAGAAQPLVGFSHSTPSAKDIALTAVSDAKSSLLIAAYQYTSPDIIKAVVAAKKRGVDVAVILDHTQENGDSQAVMVAAGIPCFIDHTYRILHHKFMVVDGVSVENGSFNFTVSADKANAENALYTTDSPALAVAYATEWQRIRALPKTVTCKGGGQ
ncbi:phospholipase D-like domain-containing protein [Curvibacter lanceolatus]|uniref:phospholipase D-like domain-containing protein n=1 Tax=Curvibacter lanceolatus TaxID=86182 RepID=UPI0003767327|nr:phospholipase D-like domain-containing protein [Curvibacter lanceolatus]